jgi:integrase
MARKVNRLTAQFVKTVKAPGRYADGGNLYLLVGEGGAKSWIFLFRWHGRQRELGFGGARDVPLARARQLAAAGRAKLAEGVEPTGVRSSSEGPTFAEVAAAVVEAMRPSWRSSTSARAWEISVKQHAAPLGKMRISAIATEDVLSVLKSLWADRPETARRLRSRIEAVLDYAKAKGMRSGENVARWKGHLDQLLPRRQKVGRKHHPAMPYGDVPAFMERLRALDEVTAWALEFCILTAARTGEVLGATWDEVDLDAALWKIPGPRMKAGDEHTVPLSPRAVEILRKLHSLRESKFVFPGRFKDTRLTDSMLRQLLHQRMKVAFTVHGFRSTFRDWTGDCTAYPRDVVESALAHAIENRVEAAYRRATAIENRRELMRSWDTFCATPPAAT